MGLKSVAAASPKRKAAPKRAPVSKAVLKDFLSGAIELAGPVLDKMGLELVQAQCPLEGGQPVLRFFIDRANAGPDDTIGLDDCAAFSRALDDVLEEAGYDHPELDDYLLEVSSPGLDRPLVKPADYERFQGRLVKMKLRRGDKNASARGRLGRSADGGLVLQAADEVIGFAFDDVISCRLSLDEVFAGKDDSVGEASEGEEA
ncbi:ribosome maturation factor [Deltaproteobacteria bacterium Smac51]|nr:ribosome maturation factor [Deltaproteobacteria bacterium Smac51]